MSPSSLRSRSGWPGRSSRPSIVNLKLTVRGCSLSKRLISAAEKTRPSFSVAVDRLRPESPGSPRAGAGFWSVYFSFHSSFLEWVTCVGLYWKA